jgi:hypothetical protein
MPTSPTPPCPTSSSTADRAPTDSSGVIPERRAGRACGRDDARR